MQILDILSRHRLAATLVSIALISSGFAFGPVTRNYIATDWVCNWCHSWAGEGEYVSDIDMSFTESHGVSDSIESAMENGVSNREVGVKARCVDCHVPDSFAGAIYSYTHFISITDLFGSFRDREAEKAGAWIPPSAARAYRVRDQLMADDSSTCRNCHIETDILPERERGQSAHEDALANKETCIKCHNNLVHRFIEVRGSVAQEDSSDDEMEDDLDDDLEDDDFEDDDLEDL